MSNEDLPPAAHEDLYTELMESAHEPGTFVVETEEESGHPDMVFEVEPADKPTRNKLQRAMPEGLFDGIEIPEDEDDAEDISTEDIDLSGVSIQDLTFGEESTNLWLDIISEHYNHEYYSDTEVRNIFSALPDDYFISAGSYLIELGESAGPVSGFRQE